MLSLMQLSETPHGLIWSYPLWTAIALLSITAALGAYAILRRGHLRRAWATMLAVAVSAWAGIYVATFEATVTHESGSTYAFLRHSQTVRWADAADIYLEQGGAGGWHIVVLDRKRRAYNFDVAELSDEDRDRVIAYIVDRIPASVSARAPELLKRQATPYARPAGFSGDQQI